jgi:hypothetical protein
VQSEAARADSGDAQTDGIPRSREGTARPDVEENSDA